MTSINSTGGECQPGFYCPKGSHEPTPCPGGFYCEGKRNFNYTGPCDAGYYCSNGSWTRKPTDGRVGNECPPGSYCPAQTQIPIKCPAGTFSNNTGKKKTSCCFLLLNLFQDWFDLLYTARRTMKIIIVTDTHTCIHQGVLYSM